MTDKIVEIDWENQWYDLNHTNEKRILQEIKTQNEILLQHFSEKKQEEESTEVNESLKIKQQIIELSQRLETIEKNIENLKTENLKLVNRMLEAEVSLERYKNLMLRKHITFPFSKFSL